jgi:hypothetical protein
MDEARSMFQEVVELLLESYLNNLRAAPDD